MEKSLKKADPTEYAKYIEAYTSGVISKESVIRIKLASQVQTAHEQNEELKSGTFSFSPSIKGKAYWSDAQTIEFKPDGKLDHDKVYEADFDLGSVAKVSGGLEHFEFEFKTIKPDFSIDFESIQTATATSLDKMKITGVIQTADNEEAAVVEKLISTRAEMPVKITWQHNAATHLHKFVLNNIARPTSGASKEVDVDWDGSLLNSDKKGNQDFEIPAVGVFKVMGIKAVQDQEQYLLYQFSNPIRVGQELTGLLGLSNLPEMAYTIDGSTVKLYPSERLNGNYAAFANAGVQDITGKKIVKGYSANVYFENRLPAVTVPGKG
ncbi:hypothetical protein [Mucilaginibacter antarcticus]|uniref:hypothetical protein n=1 Tax=Mucilaginibacter antarcticus TaxID=1855725 RepID=UPI00363E8B33